MLRVNVRSSRLPLTSCDTGAKASEDTPRAAPARPKPLDFPHYQVQGDLGAVHEYTHDFSRLFVGLEKNVSPKHLESLNVSLLGEVPLDRLVPGEYLPPIEWLQSRWPDTEAPSVQHKRDKLSNGISSPGRREFYDRAKGLLFSTDEAFESASGKGTNGAPPIRLTHSYRFYQHLLLLAGFWDTSKDNYTKEGDKEMYTGRRYGAPHEMAAEYREDTICSFLEMCIWPFRCNIQNPRMSVTRKLQFQDRYLPIQGVTSAVCCNTSDRQKARRGILEGPLMGIHCRNTTTFRREGQPVGQGKEELMDLLFEVGAALLVAQKRARQGKQEVNPGKDKFWVNRNKRHLGELGGGKQDQETNARSRREIEAFGEPMEGVEVEAGEEKSNEGASNGSRKRKQRFGAQAYLDAKPPESVWESKIEYKMIGKEAGAGADNVLFNIYPATLRCHTDLFRSTSSPPSTTTSPSSTSASMTATSSSSPTVLRSRALILQGRNGGSWR